jgi:hypothetical protein
VICRFSLIQSLPAQSWKVSATAASKTSDRRQMMN